MKKITLLIVLSTLTLSPLFAMEEALNLFGTVPNTTNQTTRQTRSSRRAAAYETNQTKSDDGECYTADTHDVGISFGENLVLVGLLQKQDFAAAHKYLTENIKTFMAYSDEVKESITQSITHVQNDMPDDIALEQADTIKLFNKLWETCFLTKSDSMTRSPLRTRK